MMEELLNHKNMLIRSHMELLKHRILVQEDTTIKEVTFFTFNDTLTIEEAQAQLASMAPADLFDPTFLSLT